MALAVAVMLWVEGSPNKTIRLWPPWADGELSTYVVVRNSADAGGGVGGSGRDGGSGSSSDAAGAPAIGSAQLGVAARGEHTALIFDYYEPGLSKRSEVLVDGSTLKPASSVIRRESAQSGQAVIAADYEPGGGGVTDVGITIASARGTESVRRELGKGVHYDAEQMVHLIRAIPLKGKFTATFSALDTASASPASVIVRVVGKETVRVPAGEFDCWRLDVQGLSMRAWVAVAAPHQLVAIELVARGTKCLLIDYAPDGGA